MKKRFLILTAGALLLAIAVLGFTKAPTLKKFKKASTPQFELRPGDVVFQDLGGPLGRAIKLATASNTAIAELYWKRRVNFTSTKRWNQLEE